jgi:flagellar protein FlaG
MGIQPISGAPTTVPATLPSAAAPAGAPQTLEAAAPSSAATPAPPAPPAVPAPPEKTRTASAEELRSSVQDAVKRANETVQVLRSNLQFTVDEATGIDVVKFIDVTTKEVIRQIPSEEMLALARRLDEIKGLLIKDKA